PRRAAKWTCLTRYNGRSTTLACAFAPCPCRPRCSTSLTAGTSRWLPPASGVPKLTSESRPARTSIGEVMASDATIANQKMILANQRKILASQKRIEANQKTLDRIVGNQRKLDQ